VVKSEVADDYVNLLAADGLGEAAKIKVDVFDIFSNLYTFVGALLQTFL